MAFTGGGTTETLEQKDELAALAGIYGALLSPRQRDFIELHTCEDLSLAEIAETRAISRQAVHDAIRLGTRSLLRYESALGLLARERAAAEALAELRRRVASNAETAAVVERLAALLGPSDAEELD